MVGSDAVMFHVHEGVLAQSPFFANALKPAWVSSRESKPINLEHVDPDIFTPYVQWLYSHQIDIAHDTMQWAKIFVLGEQFMDVEFQNMMVEVLVRCCEAKKYPICGKIDIIYSGTTKRSPVRRLLVDIYVWLVSPVCIVDECIDEKPQDFVKDLLVALVVQRQAMWKKKKSERPWNQDLSKYLVRTKILEEGEETNDGDTNQSERKLSYE
jgi:hypothetical protein